jgi:hypothetical protein
MTGKRPPLWWRESGSIEVRTPRVSTNPRAIHTTIPWAIPSAFGVEKDVRSFMKQREPKAVLALVAVT